MLASVKVDLSYVLLLWIPSPQCTATTALFLCLIVLQSIFCCDTQEVSGMAVARMSLSLV